MILELVFVYRTTLLFSVQPNIIAYLILIFYLTITYCNLVYLGVF